jgi:hypothetical protein
MAAPSVFKCHMGETPSTSELFYLSPSAVTPLSAVVMSNSSSSVATSELRRRALRGSSIDSRVQPIINQEDHLLDLDGDYPDTEEIDRGDRSSSRTRRSRSRSRSRRGKKLRSRSRSRS